MIEAIRHRTDSLRPVVYRRFVVGHLRDINSAVPDSAGLGVRVTGGEVPAGGYETGQESADYAEKRGFHCQERTEAFWSAVTEVSPDLIEAFTVSSTKVWVPASATAPLTVCWT